MTNPASIVENATHKLMWDFDIQKDHLTSARQPDLVLLDIKRRDLSK